MEEALPVMNSMNAPLELCEQVKERFLQFLNGFVITDNLDAEPSQSMTHSQGSGARESGGRCWGRSAGTHLPPTTKHLLRSCLGPPPGCAELSRQFESRLAGPARRWPRRAAGPFLRRAAGHHEGAGAQVPLREL